MVLKYIITGLILLSSNVFAAEIRPEWFSGTDTQKLQAAFDAATGGDTVILEQVYTTDATINAPNGIEDLVVVLNGRLIKGASFAGEYLLMFREPLRLQITGTGEIVGLNCDTALHSGDQGIFIGSSKNSLWDGPGARCFGDAWLRVTTWTSSNPGVHSKNFTLKNANAWHAYQFTTSQVNGTDHGGTDGLVLENVHSDGGQFKFCSRVNGAGKVVARNISSINAPNVGIEVCSISDVELTNFWVENSAGYAVNIYGNTAGAEYLWGNVDLTRFMLLNNWRGIRISANHLDSNDFYGVKINDGLIDGTDDASKDAINMTNGTFTGAFIMNVTGSNLAGGFLNVPANVVQSGNVEQ